MPAGAVSWKAAIGRNSRLPGEISSLRRAALPTMLRHNSRARVCCVCHDMSWRHAATSSSCENVSCIMPHPACSLLTLPLTPAVLHPAVEMYPPEMGVMGRYRGQGQVAQTVSDSAIGQA